MGVSALESRLRGFTGGGYIGSRLAIAADHGEEIKVGHSYQLRFAAGSFMDRDGVSFKTGLYTVLALNATEVAYRTDDMPNYFYEVGKRLKFEAMVRAQQYVTPVKGARSATEASLTEVEKPVDKDDATEVSGKSIMEIE